MKLSNSFTVVLNILFTLLVITSPLPLGATNDITTHRIVIHEGKVKGEQTLKFNQGTSINIEIKSDKNMELHVHGYDIKLDLKAGITAKLSFDAQVAGRFSVTRHDAHGNDSHGALFYIEIYPQ
ncbi:hypothetical protein [Kangiella shandongensis]|uniref:hypothetical protein n=1 Tax=Kangiella shandongensis TaxID=2763258 RepID=UPI001CC038F6|nr:hypothetical protein [Kangiella shandongensis]